MFKNLRRNKTKGFSLVELIVVIAVMAVLLAVLAPSLLQYVERSRAQKDDSAMSEVTNAIKLAVADQDVYDELLQYNELANVSGFADRITDETSWEPTGTMRGVTITFTPENHIVKLADGKINSLMKDPATTKPGTLSDLSGAEGAKEGVLYNKIRVAVGDEIELTSQTYRNSPYTVFIAMGTLGGNDPSKMDAINVYSQWGGTNLSESGGSGGGTDDEESNDLITFTVEHTECGTIQTLQAEAGMTWGEWVDSKYNTEGYEHNFLKDEDYAEYHKYEYLIGDYITCGDDIVLNQKPDDDDTLWFESMIDSTVLESDVISSDITYYTIHFFD